MEIIVPLIAFIGTLAVIYGVSAGIVYLIGPRVMMGQEWLTLTGGRAIFVIATFIVGTALMMIIGSAMDSD